MKNLKKGLGSILLGVVPSLPSALATESSISREVVNQAVAGFDEVAAKAMNDWKIPGLAVGIVVGNELVFAEGYGVRSTATRKPVTSNTLFPLGSCREPFTSMVLTTLVAEGRIAWDTPIAKTGSELLLFDEYASRHLTPRDLYCHRSGMPEYEALLRNTALSRSQVVSRLKHLPPSRSFRHSFQSSALMSVAGEHFLASFFEGSWEDSIRSRIFEPLGMTTSNFGSQRLFESGSDAAPPHEDRNGILVPISANRANDLGPSGWINSNVEELGRWLSLYLHREKPPGLRSLDPAVLKETYNPQVPVYPSKSNETSPTHYGLGWGMNTYQGHYHVRLGGFGRGYEALVSFFPYDNLGVILLANRGGVVRLLSGLKFHLADRLLHLPQQDWLERMARRRRTQRPDPDSSSPPARPHPSSPPPRPLSSYAGPYHHPGVGSAKIVASSGRITLEYNALKTHLDPVDGGTFSTSRESTSTFPSGTLLRFLFDSEGRVSGLQVSFDPGAPEVTLRKLEPRSSPESKSP